MLKFEYGLFDISPTEWIAQTRQIAAAFDVSAWIYKRHEYLVLTDTEDGIRLCFYIDTDYGMSFSAFKNSAFLVCTSDRVFERPYNIINSSLVILMVRGFSCLGYDTSELEQISGITVTHHERLTWLSDFEKRLSNFKGTTILGTLEPKGYWIE